MSISYTGINLAPHNGTGFCNQLYTLANGCIYAKNNKCRFVFISKFLKQLKTSEYCNISEIIDLQKTSEILKQYTNLDINLVDINSFKYKIENLCVNDINVTDKLTYNEYGLIHRRDILEYMTLDTNCLTFTGSINDNKFTTNIFLKKDLDTNVQTINLNLIQQNVYNIIRNSDPMFFYFLKHLVFNEHLFIQSKLDYNYIIEKYQKINCIHIKLDELSISIDMQHSKKSIQESKRIIVDKYLFCIQNYIDPNDLTILLCEEYENDVVQYLKNNNYNYITTKKYHQFRELNAIVDMHIGSMCNNVFIGQFESTFSLVTTIRSDAKENYQICVTKESVDSIINYIY